MGVDLPLLWAVIILFGIMMYVVMDGFDLGVGLLFPFFPAKEDRDVMMNSVAPVWDGNETWLVLGGAGLLAAFPLAYSVILSAVYLPIVLMLIGLVFRGVAFEFRFKAIGAGRRWWDAAFIGGSVAAAFFQGVTLGAFLSGMRVVDGQFAGGPFDWLSPFSLFTGVGLMSAYALLGSTWLVMKTEGELHEGMRGVARKLVQVMLGVLVLLSAWTPLRDPAIAERWFSLPNLFFLVPVPVLVGLVVWRLWVDLQSARGGNHASPFILTLVLVLLGYIGLGISVWPHIIPPSLSIWQAAGPPQSLGFALVGALFVIPLVLMYTAWNYWVFRGKVKHGDAYH